MQAAAYHRYQSAPNAPGANSQVSVSFGESVNAEFLRHAWQLVTQRHPVLRSAFIKTVEGLMLRESEKCESNWISLDWKSITPADIPEKWSRLMAADATTAFEPLAIPLTRWHEVLLPGGGAHYLLTVPSFLLDEFSIARVLLDLLLTLGQAPLAPLAPVAEAPKAKGWHSFLEGAGAPLSLMPRFGDGSTVRASLLLDRSGTAALSKFCHDHDLEESLVIRSLWSLLLHRFGADGNVMRCLFDGRSDSAEAGCFQNWLPVVHSWSGTVQEWLDNAQTLVDTMSENVWILPDEALRTAGLEFSSAEINTSFAWRGASINDIVHTALPRWINFDAQMQQMAPAGLCLEARPGPRLELALSGPFSSEFAAKQILTRLALLIDGLPGIYEKPVNRVPVLLPDEVLTIRDWSKGPESKTSPASVVDAFRKVASQFPQAIAVKFGDHGMTYAELDELSDKLAGHLSQAGSADGWHVGLFLSPSEWIGVAMLGAWKAGNSCLAIDPTAPDAWVEKTLSSHDVAVVICDSASASHIDPTQRRRIVIDQDWDSLELALVEQRVIDADSLAASIPGHVDGAPPQVRALTHGMLASAALEGARLLDFREGDSFLVRSMPGGGAFFDEWLIPLLSGGTAYVAGDDLLDSTTAPVTHLRLTTPEWANQAAVWQREPSEASQTIRVVAVEAGAPLSTAALIWNSQFERPIRQVVFFSPAGLCGLGLAGDAETKNLRFPVGWPTSDTEVSIVDQDGLDLPAGYSGKVFVKFPGWKNLPGASGRLGFDLGMNGWRDASGAVYLESSSHKARGIPDSEARRAARAFEENALDVFIGGSTYVLSNTPVAGATVLKEWLLTRAGWIDESTLPRPQVDSADSPVGNQRQIAETARPSRIDKSRTWQPLELMQEGEEGGLLVLVHAAEGTPDIYRDLVQALGADRRVIGIEARGLRNPEACHPSIESAAAQYIAALFEDERPESFQLAGFGFGGTLALEMARQLHAAGRPLPSLFLIGSPPPISENPSGWLSKVKKALKRFSAIERIEPLPFVDDTAIRHETAWRDYRFTATEIPATIVLPADVAQEFTPGWRELLSNAHIEITRAAWRDMLAFPAVKRVASILNNKAS